MAFESYEFKGNNRKIAEKFYTLEEFYKLKTSIPECEANRRWHNEQVKYIENYDSNWYGGLKSFEQAEKLFTEGWPEGAERLQKLATKITQLPLPKNRKRRLVVTDEGDEYRLDQILNRDWDNAYYARKRKQGLGPTVVDLMVNYGGNCNLSADQIFYQGAAAVLCADLLENAGYQVGIVGTSVDYSWETSTYWVPKIQVKAPQDPLQISNIAAMFSHAGVFRTLGFMAICDAPHNVGSCLGSIQNFNNLFNYGWEKPENSFLVDSARDEKQVLDLVTKLINEIQGTEEISYGF